MAAVVTMKQLLEAGVHFGHQTRRWNPKMKRFIYGERNGIYIIDLQQTLKRIETAYSFVRDLVADGGTILFVGTKKQAQDPIQSYAEKCGMPYINERWLGGMLTNFETISKRVGKMKEYQRMRDSGEFEAMPKKEALLISRELEKLERNLGGIRNLEQLPDAVFILDTKKEAHRGHRGQQARHPDRRRGRHQLRPRRHPVRDPRQRRRHPLRHPHVPRHRRRRRGRPLHRLPQGAPAPTPAAPPSAPPRKRPRRPPQQAEARRQAAARRGRARGPHRRRPRRGRRRRARGDPDRAPSPTDEAADAERRDRPGRGRRGTLPSRGPGRRGPGRRRLTAHPTARQTPTRRPRADG